MRLHPALNAKNLDYKQYASIIRKLSMTPGMYEKETGWAEASQVEFQRLLSEGFGLNETPKNEFMGGAGI